MAEDPRPEVTDRFRLSSGSAVSVVLSRIMPVTTAVPPNAASTAPSPAAPPAPGPAAPASPSPETPSLDVAPGSVVRVRDEDWLVTQISQTSDGTLITVQGLSELVQDTTAQFSAGIDRIEPVDPRRTRVVADTSTRHRLSRLRLEATLR